MDDSELYVESWDGSIYSIIESKDDIISGKTYSAMEQR